MRVLQVAGWRKTGSILASKIELDKQRGGYSILRERMQLRRESHFAGRDGEVPGPRGCENIAEHSERRDRAQKTQMSPGYDPRAEASW